MIVFSCINLNDAGDQGLSEVNHVLHVFAEERGHTVAVVANPSDAVLGQEHQTVYPQGRTAHGRHCQTVPKELCQGRDLRVEGVFGVIIHSLKGHVSTLLLLVHEFTNPKTHPSSPSPPQWRFGISTTSRVVLFPSKLKPIGR